MGVSVQVGREMKHGVYKHLGSYGGYHAWRCAVAHAVGIDLNKMDGYGNLSYKPDSASADVLIPWTNEPFQLVLNSSDCKHVYPFEVLPQLLKELKEIQMLGVDDYDQSKNFMAVCEYAMRAREDVVIC